MSEINNNKEYFKDVKAMPSKNLGVPDAPARGQDLDAEGNSEEQKPPVEFPNIVPAREDSPLQSDNKL